MQRRRGWGYRRSGVPSSRFLKPIVKLPAAFRKSASRGGGFCLRPRRRRQRGGGGSESACAVGAMLVALCVERSRKGDNCERSSEVLFFCNVISNLRIVGCSVVSCVYYIIKVVLLFFAECLLYTSIRKFCFSHLK